MQKFSLPGSNAVLTELIYVEAELYRYRYRYQLLLGLHVS